MAKRIEPKKAQDGILVAVWPGMGSVASTAGFYLMSKLGMKESASWRETDLTDPDHVEIQGGLVRPGKPPLGRLFEEAGARNRRVVVVYLGEDHSPSGRGTLCDRLLNFAEKAGIAEVYTFAALATDMSLNGPSKVFGVATNSAGLSLLRREKIALLKAGKIKGLNGIFLTAAAKRGMRGICLLGEIPTGAAHDPYPKASRHVLQAFTKLTGIQVDLAELTLYEESIERHLTEVLDRLKRTLGDEGAGTEEEGPEFAPEPRLSVTPADRQRIADQFAQARKDRARTFDLKRELDRLGLFKEFEDSFLDLFRESA